MGRRRNLIKKVHAVKLRHAREKIALFRQGKLTRDQLPKLALRILAKGERHGHAPLIATPQNPEGQKENPNPQVTTTT